MEHNIFQNNIFLSRNCPIIDVIKKKRNQKYYLRPMRRAYSKRSD